jgi:hypothetical protein
MSLFAENVFISANFIENKANRRKICCPGKREAGQFIIPLYISTSDGLAGVWRVGACAEGDGVCRGVLSVQVVRRLGGMCAVGCGGRRVAGRSVPSVVGERGGAGVRRGAPSW